MDAPFMDTQAFLRQRLICVAVIDHAEDGVPLTEALLSGGLEVIEVTFRTAGAAESIARIRQALPTVCVGAGTLLSAAGASMPRHHRLARSRHSETNPK